MCQLPNEFKNPSNKKFIYLLVGYILDRHFGLGVANAICNTNMPVLDSTTDCVVFLSGFKCSTIQKAVTNY